MSQLARKKVMIQGGRPLRGVVRAQGAKNAALPLLAAALLLRGGRVRIERVPDLDDTRTMMDLLRHLGTNVIYSGGVAEIETPERLEWETPANLVRKMRASSLVLGPLLAREGRAAMPLPGGCSIGGRPIDFHLKGLTKMGAEIELVHGSVMAKAKQLKGCRLYLDFPSVGATENLMMAAVAATGETVLENAAREPEIVNLAQALRAMGAKIEGEGTGTIRIQGGVSLCDATVSIIPDRIEACTYLLAGVMTGGHVTVEDVVPGHLDALLAKLEEAGVDTVMGENHVVVQGAGRPRGISVKALPYPGFPTDMQPQMMALLSIAEGTSIIQDGVFESRFLHVNELQKMGAKIDLQGSTAVVSGVKALRGADVRATDLRAGAALILAGLSASDETSVFGVEHVWRGYENMEQKLRDLGAQITVVSSEDDETA